MDSLKAPRIAAPTRCGNRLLAALPGPARRELIPHCEPVELARGDVLCEQGERIRHVYFPTGALISLIRSTEGSRRLELGVVAAEGMVGVSLMFGANTALLRALVQGAGSALRLDAAQFSHQLGRIPALGKVTGRYSCVLMSQIAQMAACARFHVVEARLARSLLMTRDRAGSDEFHLTHEFIAYLLGVRRVGVTCAAHSLQKRKLIRYRRGKITILDVPGLEEVSCGCYAATNGV
jgi:CRP-like cAMP-binding protein